MTTVNQIAGAKYYSKQELREELLEETSGLCCYCETKLQNNPIVAKVEHVQSKLGVRNQHLIFDYTNLSDSCKGSEKDSIDRKIKGTTSAANETIELLNLNNKKLNNLRKNSVFGLIFSDVGNTVLISKIDALIL